MDCTLRDGEQTSGVSFMPHEKLVIARALLQHVNVDRIEVASARVSEGELEAVKSITRWARQAGRLDSVEVLGFVDGTAREVRQAEKMSKDEFVDYFGGGKA